MSFKKLQKILKIYSIKLKASEKRHYCKNFIFIDFQKWLLKCKTFYLAFDALMKAFDPSTQHLNYLE